MTVLGLAMSRLETELSDRGGFWRLDGVGTIELPSDAKFGMTAEFHFSEISPTKINTPFKKDAITGEHFSPALNIAYLRKIPTGSVLSAGHPNTPPPLVGSYRIDTDLARQHLRSDEVCLNGLDIKEILPDSYFLSPPKIKEHLKQAQLTIVPTIGISSPKYLIIPDTELFKFYYGAGNTILKGVLNGTTSAIYSHEKSYLEEETTTIHSNRDLSRLELATIARWRNSEIAYTRMLSIRNHIVARHISRGIINSSNERHIKASFPFNGHTTLGVCGKKICLESVHGAPPIWAIFVMRIQSCSRGLGCKKVRQISGHSNKSKANTDPHEPTSLNTFVHLPEFDPSDLPLEDIPANIDLQRIHRGDGIPVELPALSDVRFEKIYQEGSDTAHVPTERVYTDIGVLTLEDGSAGKDNTGRGLDGHDEEISALSKNLELFLLCIESINNDSPIHLDTIGFESARNYNGNKINTLRAPYNRRWCSITDEDKQRPRNIIVAEAVIAPSQHIYLIEMEIPPATTGQCSIILHKTDYSKLDEDTFKNYLRLTAHQYHWATDTFESTNSYYSKLSADTFKYLKVVKLRHPNKIEENPAQPEDNAVQNSRYVTRWKNVILNSIEQISNTLSS